MAKIAKQFLLNRHNIHNFYETHTEERFYAPKTEHFISTNLISSEFTLSHMPETYIPETVRGKTTHSGESYDSHSPPELSNLTVLKNKLKTYVDQGLTEEIKK